MQFTNVSERHNRKWCDQHQSSSEQRNITFMHFIVSDKYKFVFCNTPKVASTSWQVALTRLYFRHNASQVMFYYYMRHNTSTDFMHDGYNLERNQMQQRLKTYYKFMIAREPLDRILSVYRMWFERKLHNNFARKAIKLVKSKVPGNTEIHYRALSYDQLLAALLIGQNAWRWALSYVHRFTVAPVWHYNVRYADIIMSDGVTSR